MEEHGPVDTRAAQAREGAATLDHPPSLQPPHLRCFDVFMPFTFDGTS